MTLSEQAAELQRQWERRSENSAPPVYFILDAIRQLAEASESRAAGTPLATPACPSAGNPETPDGRSLNV